MLKKRKRCAKEKNVAEEKKRVRKCRQAFPPSPPLTAPNSDSWPHWVASPPLTTKKVTFPPGRDGGIEEVKTIVIFEREALAPYSYDKMMIKDCRMSSVFVF